jgi:hypothetical protein
MTQSAFKDINRCLHFANNWNEVTEKEWEGIYLNKKYQAPAAAKHQSKVAIVEDAHNETWKEVIVHDKVMTYKKAVFPDSTLAQL